MLVLGLTGPSGSGKGAVGCFFAETGIPVLDTDTVYHALIDHSTSCTEELKNAFGDTILTKEGGIDRKRLASLVFDPADEKKEKLLLKKLLHISNISNSNNLNFLYIHYIIWRQK